MNCKLLEFMIKNFTKEGETVLDPMCGSGSTGVIAALCGRNAIQVDIEEKFVKWAEEAKQKVESGPSLTTKGSIINVCGDARKLSELLTKADSILTSPPYSDSLSKHAGGPTTLRAGFKRGISTDSARQYSEADKNIGNLPHGSVDAIVTSPENISKLPLGNVDAVITSPPYSESQTEVDGEKGRRGGDAKQRVKKDYASVSKENIGSLKHDEVARESYLEAMLKVYSEMWKVLKPNGLAIIVIKPFIRNKKVADLPYHTWLLLQKVGFKLTKLYKLRLKNPSFWRILYHKKHPTVPKINHEYILVVTKHGVSM